MPCGCFNCIASLGSKPGCSSTRRRADHDEENNEDCWIGSMNFISLYLRDLQTISEWGAHVKAPAQYVEEEHQLLLEDFEGKGVRTSTSLRAPTAATKWCAVRGSGPRSVRCCDG